MARKQNSCSTIAMWFFETRIEPVAERTLAG